MRNIETITPAAHDLGGFKVRRTLHAKSRTMVGPFISDIPKTVSYP